LQAFACRDCQRSRNRAEGRPTDIAQSGWSKREQRTAAFAVNNRVSGNFVSAPGANLPGFIVASAQRLSFVPNALFLERGHYAAFALIVLAAVPSRATETRHMGRTDSKVNRAFRAVARDRPSSL